MRTLRTWLIALIAALLAVSLGASLALAAPAAPTGLNGAAAGSSAVNLVWNPVTEAANYRVYCGISASKMSLAVMTPSANCTVEGLAPDTKYYFKVQVVAADSSAGSFSSTFCVRTGRGFSAPRGLRVTLIDDTQIDLTWDRFTMIKRYTVYRAESSSGPYRKIGTTDILAFGDINPPSGRKLYYKVRAVDEAGEGNFSTAISALARPAAPTGLSATSPATGGVKLTWSAATGAAKYRVYTYAMPGGACVNTAETTKAYYSNAKLTPGAEYYFRVLAINKSGESPLSGAVPVLIRPGVPASLRAVACSASQVQLTWNASSSAARYAVYRAKSSSGSYTRLAEVESPMYTDENLTGGRTYYYKVTAINSSGEGGSCGNVSVWVPTGAPSVPKGLAAKAQGSNGIKLTWKAASQAGSYIVYRCAVANGTYEKIGEAIATVYLDKSLAMKTTYYYKVSSLNPFAESVPSVAISGKTSSSPPPVPLGLHSEVWDMSSIRLVWEASNAATRYAVYRAKNDKYIKIGETSQITYLDTGLRAGTTYYYKVAAIGAYGQSAQSLMAICGTSSSLLPAPGNPTAQAYDEDSVDVRYDAVPGAVGYVVLYADMPSQSKYTNFGGSTGLSSRVVSLESNTTYYFWVCAVDAYGASGTPSAPVIATTPPALECPAKPDFVLVDVSYHSGSYMVTFDHAAGLSYPGSLNPTFEYYCADTLAGIYYGSRGSVSVSDVIGKGNIQFTVPYGKAKWFGFRVRLGNHVSELQTMQLAAFNKITGVSLAPSDNSVTLCWSPLSQVGRYNLYVCTKAPDVSKPWPEFKEEAKRDGALVYKGHALSTSVTLPASPSQESQYYIVVPATSSGVEGPWCGYAVDQAG